MSELFTQPSSSAPLEPQVETDQLTTAPGDLPAPEIIARIAAQRHQFRHDNNILPSIVQDGQEVEIWALSGANMPLERAALFYTIDGSFPGSAAQKVPCERMSTSWDPLAGYLIHWRARVPAQTAQTVVRYRIGGWKADNVTDVPDAWAQDGEGFWFRYSGSQALTTFAYNVEGSTTSCLPAWAESAILYHIFLDRFATDTPELACTENLDDLRQLHGGTLRGVIAALPYLESLGVNCLWLSPVYPAESYHRYDALDFYNVDPRLGRNDDLKDLTTQAHARGMRVLLDFVPSHLSWHHPAFVSAQQDRHTSTASWFTFDEWPDRYRCFLQTAPTLASLNGDDEQAREYIIGSAVQWLRDYGVDGFRLDHAIGQGMDFWTAFRRATRAASSESITIGEVTDTPDCLASYHGKLDLVLDFPLASALRHTFALCDWTVKQLDHFLFSYEQFMVAASDRVSFLDNHDMNRFLFLANNDVQRLKLAALCQFTLNALPIIYYGTEIGMSQQADATDASAGGDAQARSDMVWDQSRWNEDVLAFYRVLIQLRKSIPVLRQGQRHTVHLDATTSTYAYIRTSTTQRTLQADDAIVLFNLSDQCQFIPLSATVVSAKLRCLLATGEQPAIEDMESGYRVRVAPGSGAIFSLS